MSNSNPYEQLGVSEDSSFDEIQDARDRLFAEHKGDRKQLEVIEAAYDAVLMERLRMRQEGKIKVPDRIRFPEKAVQPTPAPTSAPAKRTPDWLQRLVDTPSQADIWLPAGIFAALSTLVIASPALGSQIYSNTLQISLILGVGASFYFLFRKEKKLGRTVLLGLGGLILGFLIGGLTGFLLQTQLLGLGIRSEMLTTVVTFLVLWLISSFLR